MSPSKIDFYINTKKSIFTKRFEEVFYGGKGKDPTDPHEPEQAENTAQAENTPQTSEESDVQALLRLLSDPEAAKLLKTLVNGL